MYFYNRDLSVRIDSVALHSTALDSLSDCISTAAVLICQVLSLIKGWQLDGWCGLLVSAFILRTGLQTIMETADPLVGKAPDPDLITGISERVLHTKGILDMHDLLVHDYGPGPFCTLKGSWICMIFWYTTTVPATSWSPCTRRSRPTFLS